MALVYAYNPPVDQLTSIEYGGHLPPSQGAYLFLGGKKMNRFVVLVDAGYLFSQAISLVSQKQSKSRGDLTFLDPAGLVTHLVDKARLVLNIPLDRELLRVYWYDGVMATIFQSRYEPEGARVQVTSVCGLIGLKG